MFSFIKFMSLFFNNNYAFIQIVYGNFYKNTQKTTAALGCCCCLNHMLLGQSRSLSFGNTFLHHVWSYMIKKTFTLLNATTSSNRKRVTIKTLTNAIDLRKNCSIATVLTYSMIQSLLLYSSSRCFFNAFISSAASFAA